MSLTDNQIEIWPSALCDPSGERERKPRTTGLTMVMDKGLGLGEFKDMLELAHEHIDIIKMGFGTAAVMPHRLLTAKLNAAKRYGITVMPGGTFLEIAVVKGIVEDFFHMMGETGFTGVEVSDGTISLSRQDRNDLIARARELGFHVCSEYGKKDSLSSFLLDDLLETFTEDIAHGSAWMTLEGRESGIGVGVYDDSGSCDTNLVTRIVESVHTPERLMWEAPRKDQQVAILHTAGLRANIGNIAPQEIIACEALRRGLRSDTMNQLALPRDIK
ncbi:phosphosulfolactate synthase [Paenibacillus apiarius]|uniref:phosphosulfolactate synthase n=1 Tax=Paenibacillus apiarius TaxID=46240 RepID=UPI001980F004|nr:phosphosulfolactate synthase [Paenibacillus apiarius]MBN3522336.1 phosphosulfolactate synthase [Paenibacillus apiarius]